MRIAGKCAKYRKSRRAFTLIEMIVALTVFTAVAFSLAVVLQQSVDAQTAIRQTDQVTEGLRNQWVIATSQQLVPVDKELDNSDDSPIKYRLTIATEKVVNHDKVVLNGMYRVTLSATWTSDGEPQTEQISQLVYQP